MRLLYAVIIVSIAACSTVSGGIAPDIQTITNAYIWSDGGSILIEAQNSKDEKIRYELDLSLGKESEEKSIIENGNKIRPFSKKEYLILSELHKWVLNATQSKDIGEAKDKYFIDQRKDSITISSIAVISLVEEICFLRYKVSSYHDLCKLYFDIEKGVIK